MQQRASNGLQAFHRCDKFRQRTQREDICSRGVGLSLLHPHQLGRCIGKRRLQPCTNVNVNVCQRPNLRCDLSGDCAWMPNVLMAQASDQSCCFFFFSAYI